MPDRTPSLQEFEAWDRLFPAADRARMIAPVRVGMDRRTGKILAGFPHVEQSLEILFATRYHERILRQWAGSFVPHMLGQNTTQPTITRFWWAIISACDLWEPCYAIKQVFLKSTAAITLIDQTTVDGIRKGEVAFAYQGVYMPRGHLGDKTPDTLRSSTLTGRGNEAWNR